MFNLAGCLVIFTAALFLVCEAHGADMGKQNMVEIPAGLKALSFLAKCPLAIISVTCAMIGACVVSAYQTKDRLKQFLINASVAIILTPFATEIAGFEPTIANWAATALALGIFTGIILKITISPEVQEAFKAAMVHQINHRLGDEGDEKGKE